MNVKEFAEKHLNDYRINGDEITPKLCPYCHGGSNSDKDTFGLNISKNTFNCLRGSCGKNGTFKKLCEDFNEQADGYNKDNYELKKVAPKVYGIVNDKIFPFTAEIAAYMAKRKISKKTLMKYDVSTDGKGNIAFPYYQDNELVLVKYRPCGKIQKGQKKAWRSKDGKPVFWGMDLCTTDKPLIITEGEMDTLACAEAGIDNVVSVPSGTNSLGCVETCWDWLEQFKEIILFGDNDEPGQEMIRKLILKLGEWRCKTVDNPFKDANILLYRNGKEAVSRAVTEAKDIPIDGLINLADVVPLDLTKLERVKSNIMHLDNKIGGFYMGELSVWTGENGNGKSTLLGQMLLESLEQNYPVCAYSGELRADKFQHWMHLQMAGQEYLQYRTDPDMDKQRPYVEPHNIELMKHWYNRRFFLYDNNINSRNANEAGIIEVFIYAARKYGCKVFLVDNLMTAGVEKLNDRDYYRAQSIFVRQLSNFAKTFNVHVHLVAHPRKDTIKGKFKKTDIMGTGDIPNIADNIFAIEREKDIKGKAPYAILSILKNRNEGIQDVEIGMCFDKESKRFYQPTDKEGASRRYGWTAGIQQQNLFQEIDIICPWDEVEEKTDASQN